MTSTPGTAKKYSKIPSAKVINVTGQLSVERNIWNDYEKGPVLGKGAYGTVYEVKHQQTGCRRAAKAIAKSRLVTERDVADVQREMQVLLLVGDYPNVAALVETYEDAENVYFVLELCEGGELFDAIVARGTFSEKLAAAHFRTMVQVCHHCHQLGVIHRDIKPENFLLTTHGDDAVLKAADFGLSTYFKAGQVFDQIVGSAFYVAPEVLRRKYSHQADMWSLGVVLYILLSGVPPFWGPNEASIFKMTLSAPLDLSSRPWHQVSGAAKDLLRRLLNRNPALRATPQEVLGHPWLREQGVAPEQPLAPEVLQRMGKFAAMNRLKKAAVLVMARCLLPAELAGLSQLFLSIDTDGNGTISVSELKAALEGLGDRIQDAELQELVGCADMNGDGVVDWEEFLAATVHLNKLKRDELLSRAFQFFDADGSGAISLQEIMEALKDQGISMAEAEDIMSEWDTDNNGSISWEEFKAVMLRKEDGGYRRALHESRSLKVDRLLINIPELPMQQMLLDS